MYRVASSATTIVEAGPGPRAFDRAAGFPIEIIPLTDPVAAAGDTLMFRLTINGEPLSGLLVRVGLVR